MNVIEKTPGTYVEYETTSKSIISVTTTFLSTSRTGRETKRCLLIFAPTQTAS